MLTLNTDENLHFTSVKHTRDAPPTTRCAFLQQRSHGMHFLVLISSSGALQEWELLLCAVEGVLGGVLGALFVKLHTAIAAMRPKTTPPPGARCCRGKRMGGLRQKLLRLLEVVGLSLITSVVMYGLPYIGSDQGLGWACQVNARSLQLAMACGRRCAC